MARYLLDTSALIDFAKGYEPAHSTLLQLVEAGDELGVCPVNVAEFYTALEPSQYRLWDEFFAALGYWPISPDSARQAGVWRYSYARHGTPLSTADTLIAAVALEQAAVLITGNVKDYPMPELQMRLLTR
jgi:predicted nucleic acid-binding protein